MLVVPEAECSVSKEWNASKELRNNNYGSVNGSFAKIRLRALTNSTNLVLLTANRIHLVLTGFPVELEANSDLE